MGADMREKSDHARWLKGGNARCNLPPATPPRTLRLVLLGTPGAGKGTQAELIHEQLGACQLSTGDLFRGIKALAECERTLTSRRALECMARGDLVPDEIVLSLVEERSACLACGGGFLLDGFPRTVAQARALEHILARKFLKLDAVIAYELPLSEVVRRLGGRRTCPNCKRSYHIEAVRPKTPGICDHCRVTLIQREDDRPEAIRVRLEAYEKNTAPLTDYYRQKGLLVPIDAADTPRKTFERTREALIARLAPETGTVAQGGGI
jgi:adenylate kinase